MIPRFRRASDSRLRVRDMVTKKYNNFRREYSMGPGEERVVLSEIEKDYPELERELTGKQYAKVANLISSAYRRGKAFCWSGGY